MIPEDVIARVRESVDLVELVREQVPQLKRAGRNWRARCPFHQERTPSFNVNPDMGVYKCFGCGAGGDAFKFLMQTEGLSYPEAIRKLADRVGIAIPDDAPAVSSAEAQEKEQLYRVMEDAARFYHRTLLESPEAGEAREYLKKRGVERSSLEKFRIGYAPKSGFGLRDAAEKRGVDLRLLEKAGLVRRKEGRTRLFDNFWDRILFPIWDTQGRLIAFGGRAMGDAMPKYINSPDTPLYEKSRHLYGLFQGLPSVRKARRLVVLEGYMDVVVCHQFGFEITAATLGTALTDSHVRILRRYVDHVTLLFDPDAAGAQATVRGGELLVAAGFQVDVVTLPDAMDPDELLLAQGADALDGFLARAVPYLDYRRESSVRRHPGSSPESKLAIAKELLPVIRSMPDPLLQDEHLGRLAAALRADKQALGRQMKLLKREGASKSAEDTGESSAPEVAAPKLEEELILAAMLYPSGEAAALLRQVEWTDVRAAAAWRALEPFTVKGESAGPAVWSSLDDATRSWLERLAVQERQYARPLEVLNDFVVSAKRQRIRLEWESLKSAIDAMNEGRIPVDQAQRLRFNELSQQLKGSRSHSAQEAMFHG